MIFNDFIVVLNILFASCLQLSEAMRNQKLVVYEKGTEDIIPASVALHFFVNLNNTGEHDYQVTLIPNQCCIDVGDKVDCNIVELVGRSAEVIPSGNSKYLKLIAPLLDPFERKGFCKVFVDSKLAGNLRMMRNTARIPFDTRLQILDQTKLPKNVKHCKQQDQDPLNNCQPVNCLRYYNGRKSYFNKLVQKCQEVPPCITEVNTEMPKRIYNPINNQCVNDSPISQEDVAFVKSLVHVEGDRKPKDIVIIRNHKNNANNLSHSHPSLSKANNTDYPSPPSQTFQQKSVPCYPGYRLVTFVMNNRCAYCALVIVVLLQCGLLCALCYLFTQKCLCCQRKKIIRKYFNYRQDASVTTPLIETSNLETETTDYQYLSETSNLDKKVQDYKACQRYNANNYKISLSDDILSKCLNRRDWRHQTTKDGAVQDYNTKIFMENEKQNEDSLKKNSNNIVYEPKVTDSKTKQHVNLESEKTISDDSKKQNKVKNLRKMEHKTSRTKRSTNNIQTDSELVFSEQEIKCHSYNYMDEGSNLQRTLNYNVSAFRPSQTHNLGFVEYKTKSRASSIHSMEKSAQASFSNDSIDDLLSERGMLFLAGDNISKYSLSSHSKSISYVSSKTSKKNVVKNVLSMLRKKSRDEPLSDPGITKSTDSFNLEILHLMQGSAYASSNESDGIKICTKKFKDSRTSL